LTPHTYQTTVTWSAAGGPGTAGYRSYSRNHSIAAGAKPEIAASSDPAFRGDRERYNPEELLLASISSCHMLWYLHLCAVNGIVVREYRDRAVGRMVTQADGAGQFVRAELHPLVEISAPSDPARALALHEEAHRLCFIARSVNFDIEVMPEVSNVTSEDSDAGPSE
jgi:organic hydroperoxide reductase OsmC/OhrA